MNRRARDIAFGGNVWTVDGVLALVTEPVDAELFELVFGDHAQSLSNGTAKHLSTANGKQLTPE